ncbi:MAG: HXXEE domain-containing protein [Eubacteriales bacterium]|nr:HXXEE domain-containing protein [Eubacteriales bacterium]
MKKGMNWWCDRAWIKFGCAITAGVTAAILWNWTVWSAELKIVAAVAALIPMHVVEEWVFPGGFHYQYNSLFHSKRPDRYPMCRLSDMITNLGTTILFLVLALICDRQGYVSPGLLLGIMIFSALEVVFHTAIGVSMYLTFRKNGKSTIYGPGSITAYLGFGVLGVLSWHSIRGGILTGADWGIAIALLAVIAVGFILIPENVIKRTKCDRYYFRNAGYFQQFLR